jgi:hypothetical protein
MGSNLSAGGSKDQSPKLDDKRRLRPAAVVYGTTITTQRDNQSSELPTEEENRGRRRDTRLDVDLLGSFLASQIQSCAIPFACVTPWVSGRWSSNISTQRAYDLYLKEQHPTFPSSLPSIFFFFLFQDSIPLNIILIILLHPT